MLRENTFPAESVMSYSKRISPSSPAETVCSNVYINFPLVHVPDLAALIVVAAALPILIFALSIIVGFGDTEENAK